MPRVFKAVAVGMMLSAMVVALPAAASGATNGSTASSYHVVEPIYATPGQVVYVTGTGKYVPDTGFYATTCNNQTVSATVTYFTTSGSRNTTTTDLGTANVIVGVQQPVTIPGDAAPTGSTSSTPTSRCTASAASRLPSHLLQQLDGCDRLGERAQDHDNNHHDDARTGP